MKAAVALQLESQASSRGVRNRSAQTGAFCCDVNEFNERGEWEDAAKLLHPRREGKGTKATNKSEGHSQRYKYATYVLNSRVRFPKYIEQSVSCMPFT